jgi:hypothetical protein
VAALAIGQPAHLHLAEDQLQLAGVVGLDGAACHPVGVGDVVAARLAHRPQLQVVLGELAHQLAALSVELDLQLGVVQPGGLAALQPAHQPLEDLPGRLKVPRLACGVLARRAHRRFLCWRRAARRARSAAKPLLGVTVELGAGGLVALERRGDPGDVLLGQGDGLGPPALGDHQRRALVRLAGRTAAVGLAAAAAKHRQAAAQQPQLLVVGHDIHRRLPICSVY